MNQDLSPSVGYDALRFKEFPDIGLIAVIQRLLDLRTEFTHRRQKDIGDWSDRRLIEVACQFQGPAIYM